MSTGEKRGGAAARALAVLLAVVIQACASGAVRGAGLAPPGATLTKCGVVLPVGAAEAWDGGMVESPAVWFDPARDKWGMVYTGYDLRFPELYRQLVDKGAIALAIPAAFTLTTGKDHWHVLLRARAIEAQSYVLAAAQTGHHFGSRRSYGHALICDPWGTVLAECGEGEGVATAWLDPEVVARVRASLPSLQHRVL